MSYSAKLVHAWVFKAVRKWYNFNLLTKFKIFFGKFEAEELKCFGYKKCERDEQWTLVERDIVKSWMKIDQNHSTHLMYFLMAECGFGCWCHQQRPRTQGSKWNVVVSGDSNGWYVGHVERLKIYIYIFMERDRG